MRSMMFVLAMTAALGCGKKKEGGEAANTKPAETKPADPAAKPADPAAAPAAPAAPAAAATNGEPVDICALAPKEEMEKLLGGKLMMDPKKDDPRGSLLGGCTWMTDKGSAMVSARPTGEFDATASGGSDVAGVGEKALMTKNGLMVKVAGKPYFLHVITMTGTNQDHAKAADVAKIIAK